MDLKQNSDQTENLRQALKSFRDAIDALFYPLPSALENIVLAERLIEDFNVSQPLVGFTPFDALKSEANIDIANNATKDKTPKPYRNTDLERHQSTKSRGTLSQHRFGTASINEIKRRDNTGKYNADKESKAGSGD